MGRFMSVCLCVGVYVLSQHASIITMLKDKDLLICFLFLITQIMSHCIYYPNCVATSH